MKDRMFLRNVLALAGGTALAQGVTIAATPLLTRLFGPDAIGIQSAFISVVNVGATVAALGYPTAIVLPVADRDAIVLARLSVLLSATLCAIASLLLWWVGGALADIPWMMHLAPFAPLIPLAIMLATFGAIMNQWLIRKGAFGLSAMSAAANSLLYSGARIVIGLVHPAAAGLVHATTASHASGTIISWAGWWFRRNPSASGAVNAAAPSVAAASTLELAVRHRDFPLFRAPQNLINALSQGLPVLLLAAHSGPGVAGQYAIALMVLTIPANLIGTSFASVFYPRVTEVIARGEAAHALILGTMRTMAGLGAVPYAAVLLLGPVIFPWVLGVQWRQAGEFAQVLAPWLFLQYLNRPAVAAVPALKLQKGLLVYELFSTATKMVALWAGLCLFGSDLVAVALFSLAGSVAYIWLINWILRRSLTCARDRQ